MSTIPFKIELLESAPILSGDAAVVVRARAVHIPLPFAHGGIIWNRPVSVLVRRPGLSDLTLPVHDVTRLLQLALLALGLAAGLVFGSLMRARNND
jgi:hypothetical protein